MVSIVVAYAENRGIGYRGDLPWRLPSDLRRFRELTMGAAVLMGRKTYESLPDAYRPLPGRRNVVLSANAGFDVGTAAVATAADARPGDARPPDAEPDPPPDTNVELHASIDAALETCGGDCFVIGGGSVYEQALPLAQRVYATLVQGVPRSDTFFPELPPGEWRRSECSEEIHENGQRFRFAVYDRIP
jgi:dihydrofolate reductase